MTALIPSGSIDRRITIQRATIVEDGFGNAIEVWGDLAEVWASIQYIRDEEIWRAQQVQSTATVRFTIRWGWNVTTLDRIVYENKSYNIVGIKEIGRREGQELTAAVDVDNG